MMRHIYLSPHLDDVVLSCGATIHRRTEGGQEVQVVTIFAGDPEPGAQLSPFALLQHEYWGHPARPMALRRAEDAAALISLDAEGTYLDFLDAVYRASTCGEWLYTTEDSLWNEVRPGDPMGQDGAKELAERLANLTSPTSQTVVYAPLGVGNHIDHQLVHAAARQLLARGQRLAFYEDYPYAAQPDATEAALVAAGARAWRVEVIPLQPADLTAKITALGYYRTQMAVLFGGAEAMPNLVWSFAASPSPEAGLAERIWWPTVA
jgi:LmbE family N-acetylglucosaminyl deacetylase